MSVSSGAVGQKRWLGKPAFSSKNPLWPKKVSQALRFLLGSRESSCALFSLDCQHWLNNIFVMHLTLKKKKTFIPLGPKPDIWESILREQFKFFKCYILKTPLHHVFKRGKNQKQPEYPPIRKRQEALMTDHGSIWVAKITQQHPNIFMTY